MTTPVLLIPGGAASASGYYPRLPEALDGHPVVTVDRPGTGTARDQGRARLASGAACWAEALRQVSDEPAVVVGQSLGAVVALQLAVDFPDLVAGLVLLDPTPFDDPKLIRTVQRTFAVLGLPGRLPVVGRGIDRALFSLLSRDMRDLAPDAKASLECLVGSATLSDTAAAIADLPAEGALLAPRLEELGIPVVLVTADRKAGHRVTAKHEALASTLGARVVTWPGCVHAMHLTHPDKVLALVQGVLEETAVRA